MTQILVPTDFSPQSLQWAEEAVRLHSGEKIDIILFHAFDLTANPYDLLGASRRDPSAELMSEAFRLACRQLKQRYPDVVASVHVKTMRGNTRTLFRNFAEAQDIDLIYCPPHFTFQAAHPLSIDPVYLFAKSGIPHLKPRPRSQAPARERAALQRIRVSAS